MDYKGRARMRAKKKQNQIDPYDRGTPQTRAKIRTETTLQRVVREERKRGSTNTPELQRAGLEIERCFSHTVRRLYAKSSSLERVDGCTPADTPDWIVSAYTERYVPWTRYLEGNRKSRLVSLVIDIVVEDLPLHKIEWLYNLSRGKAKELLIEGLELYADLAGWNRTSRAA